MIISSAHDFGFVHIAKCAGSTIRQQLREYDDLKGQFSRTISHPVLGPINGQHVPLATLQAHFPDAFHALQSVISYTVVRAPLDRFVSGVSQLIRDRGGEPGEMTADQILATALGAADYMRQSPDLPDRAHILFAPQHSYTHLEDRQVVTHIYAMENLAELVDRIETQHGLALIRDQTWNPTVTYRFKALTRPLKSMKTIGQQVLPLRAYVTARDVGIRLFARKGVPKLDETLRGSAEICDFVASQYAKDRALYHSALKTLDTAPSTGRAAP